MTKAGTFQIAMAELGYVMSKQLVDLVFNIVFEEGGIMLLSDFMKGCLTMQKMSDAFHKHRTRGRESAIMGFTDFLTSK